MQILFVDDSEPIIIEMKRILEGTNHEMVVARDGGQGLAELSIKNFDIVIFFFIRNFIYNFCRISMASCIN